VYFLCIGDIVVPFSRVVGVRVLIDGSGLAIVIELFISDDAACDWSSSGK
jgi:hypothetical protein